MAIATLMATSALFLLAGWTAAAYGALALTIGGTVCIAAANAGNTSQDLKTGFLVGATPSAQQKGLFLGVLASCFAIGITLIGMNKALEKFVPADIAVDIANPGEGVNVESTGFEHDGRAYTLLNVIGSTTIAEGKYLLNPQTGRVELQWIQGIGSQDAPAPQARLMSVVINGILNRRLPWGLVLLGVFLVFAVELLGIRSLSFAVGSYLSIGTTAAIFCGGIVRWLVERGEDKAKSDDEASPGALYASGLIAAGGIVGLLAICVKLLAAAQEKVTWLSWFPTQWGAVGEKIGWTGSSALGMLVFAALAYSLYYFARKPLEDVRKG
jgi:uncharacterized oligopeptide transporter (OPT) family protein